MKSRTALRRSAALGLSVFVLAACGAPQQQAAPEVQETSQVPQELLGLPQLPHAPVCATDTRPGYMRCHSWVVTDGKGNFAASSMPAGIAPADLQAAYELPAATGGKPGPVVAIVDSNDDPSAEADLAVYRAQWGLPPCTTANGCFRKVSQRGGSDYPAGDQGWGMEISLDLDMVSAVCPQCRILLVEADSPTMDNLGTAVNTAVQMGALAISNSYGGPEDSTIVAADEQYFNHPGVSIFVSAGDTGYGVEYPASSQYVTSVGGTSLVQASSSNSRGWAEGIWGHRLMGFLLGGTGSGCSQYINKPSWEKDQGCPNRMVADVSAVADPSSGVAVYDTYGNSGWFVVGGTSASSPIVAGVYALTGHAGASPALAHAHPEAFFDEKSGSNGWCLFQPGYFCNASAGYDGPTGWGTPNGQVLERVSH